MHFAFLRAQSLQLVARANPYHDEEGQFTSKDKDVIGQAGWKRESGNLGSNEGGVYTRSKTKYYVKFPNAKGQIHAEEAADKIYELMGVGTMNHRALDVNGRLASVSEWKNVEQLGREGWSRLTPKQIDQAAEAFVASALTKNWDVVGLVYDNMGADSNGKLHIMDTGGSFQYRAQGEPKAYETDPSADIRNMSDPSRTAGSVFNPLIKNHRDAFVRAAQKLKSLTNADLLGTLGKMETLHPGTGQALLQRRDAIVAHFS